MAGVYISITAQDGGFLSLNCHKLSSVISFTGAGDVRNERQFSVHRLALKC